MSTLRTPDKATISFKQVRAIFFFGTLGILGLAVLYLFRPFIYPIFWAAVIAVTLYPLHKKIHHVIKKSGPSAALSVLTVVLIVFIPISILSILVVNESLDLYQKVAQSGMFEDPPHMSTWLENTPLAPYLEEIRTDWTEYASNITQAISQFIFQSIKSVTQNSLKFFVMSMIMLYTLYYFFKDGKRILRRLSHLSPLSAEYEELLYRRFTSTVGATLKSTLIIGGIQGTLGGLLFLITGIPGVLIWSIIMIIIAIIPAVGTSIILVPAGIIMFAMGNIWQAIVLLAGALLISVLDNLLRPPLVGRDTQMHPLLIFFATLGGLLVFGISGFVIGPVLVALFLSVLSIYDYYYKKQLDNT